jgi:hypothetical protein
MSEDTLRKRLSAGWDPVEAVTAAKQVTNRPRALRDQVPDGAPGSRTWYDLPYEKDEWAREFVKAHPDGASMEDVGAAIGVEVSWICEIEQGAFKKLKAKLAQVAAGGFESLNGQLGFLGGRDSAADVDVGAFVLLELLTERLGLEFGEDDEGDRGEDEEEEWEGEVIGEAVPLKLPAEARRSAREQTEDDEAARWLSENDATP